jgi:RNA polymerase sigma factor (sigma-70 family)
MLKNRNDDEFPQIPEIGSNRAIEKNDSLVWDEFRAGNESAFIQIYQDYFDKLYGYGMRIVRNEDLVKDAIQDMFIDLRKNRSHLGNTTSIKFYLFKCIKRKIIKEEGKWIGKLENLDPSYYFQFEYSHEQHLIDQQINEEKQKKINLAIENLSPRKKEIIYYFYHEGLSYLQIQELMGLDNVKSARNLIYKALNLLKVALQASS